MLGALPAAMWQQLMSVLGYSQKPNNKNQTNQEQKTESPTNKLLAKPIGKPVFITPELLKKAFLDAVANHDLEKLHEWLAAIKEAIYERKISAKTGIDLTLTIPENKNNFCETFPLIITAAAEPDDCTLLQALINAGANPDLKDSHKRSALMAAAAKGFANKFICLLRVSQHDLLHNFDQVVENILLGDNPEILQVFTAKVKNLPDGFYRNIFTKAKKLKATAIQDYLIKQHYVSSNTERIKKLENLVAAV